jgi:hypothetical protein
MKLLLIQERGRHEKNRNFRECENFKRSFQRLGVECEIWGLGYDNYNVSFSEIVKDKDIIFSIENYDSGWTPDLSQYSDKLKIFWSVDSHCALPSHLKTVIKNKFNIVLNSIEAHQEYFKNYSKTFYFPNAYPNDLIYPKEHIEKKYDVGFCGSVISDRQIWLDFLSKHFNIKKDIFVIGEEMVDAICSYKLAFNKTLADDINYRVFETLGCKTALITNKPPGIEKFFIDDKHIIYYSNPDELKEKILYYLNNQEKLKEISLNGYNEAISKHTYDVRAKQFLELLDE